MAAVNGDVILKARLRKGMTQQDVADACTALGQALDHSNFSKMERKRTGCSPRLLPVLAEVLDLDMDELVTVPGNGNGSAA